MRVLIVDDSATMRRIIKNTLTNLGHKELIEAEDGLAAWNIIKNEEIDLLLTDWNMPNMSGYELVTKIRADERYAKVPIVMITTEGGKDEVIKALKAGVNNYIVKPFTPQVLKEKLEPLLNKQ